MQSLATILFVQSIMGFLFRVLLMSTVLLGAGLVACRFMKRSAAADRHAVLTTALIAVLFAPLLTGALPSIPVFRGLNDGESVALLVPSRVDVTENAGIGAWVWIPWFLREPALYMLAITLVWPFGVFFFGARLLTGFSAASSLRRLPLLSHGMARRTAEEVIGELGIRRRVFLVRSALPTPVTTGILAPVVVVPHDIDQWSSCRQRCVMHHELAHVRRMDVMWQGIAHVVRTILWLHPLAWIAAKRLCAESEAACDAAVVESGVRPSEYAQELLHIAANAERATVRPYAFAIGMSYGPRLATRVTQLLRSDTNTVRAPRSRQLLYFAAACALALLIPFGLRSYSAKEEPSAMERGGFLVEDKVPTSAPFEAAAPSPR